MENHGKIMEFDSGKALGTLMYYPRSSSRKQQVRVEDMRSHIRH